ncbi:hypothetical protein DAPPUDRAFT_104605 [Daphnia pulex]|uniref:Uncharacterized protein n=1 Tax=Daphnia pulex TaxID=6669 RepID=E9GMR6_DAPPU|nr:hypothetical protein DAPPUDRAFT_104605 [Daphnia pulex]|eukprot:EFX79141.1 hypothetical protein DAPPUDRAFT_104605 [Daphnia pulex]
MAKSNLEDDIFKVLKQRGIELNTNVENIFRFTGNNNARTLANFNCATGVQEIEECVRSTLGKKERHVKMDSQKRTATFGEWVDAHIALTAKGVKDGLNFPRFTRSFEDTRSHPRFTMPGIEQINDVLLKARNDAENALATLGLRAKGKDKFDFPQDLSQQLNSTNAKKKKIVPSTAGHHPRNLHDICMMNEHPMV